MPKAKAGRRGAISTAPPPPRRGYELHREGDLSISVLSCAGIEISKEQYETLLGMPQEERHAYLHQVGA